MGKLTYSFYYRKVLFSQDPHYRFVICMSKYEAYLALSVVSFISRLIRCVQHIHQTVSYLIQKVVFYKIIYVPS